MGATKCLTIGQTNGSGPGSSAPEKRTGTSTVLALAPSHGDKTLASDRRHTAARAQAEVELQNCAQDATQLPPSHAPGSETMPPTPS